MSKGKQHYIDEIVDGAYVDVYVATPVAMMEYPLCLEDINESSPTTAEQADRYILDSGLSDDSVDAEDILDRAEYLEADWVVPADAIGDPETTTVEILDMLDLVADRSYDPTVLLPLQADDESEATHSDHYDRLSETLADRGEDIADYPLAVGGILDRTPVEQLEAVVAVREHVGLEPYIHAFGMGCARDWVVAVQRCPWLLDGLDMSTAMQAVINGRVIDMDCTQHDHNRPRGTNSTVLTVLLSEYILYMLNYVLGPHIREDVRQTEFQGANAQAIEALVSDHEAWHETHGGAEHRT